MVVTLHIHTLTFCFFAGTRFASSRNRLLTCESYAELTHASDAGLRKHETPEYICVHPYLKLHHVPLYRATPRRHEEPSPL